MSAVITPFRQFVLKVHSRCDLACDHCYVYEHADQSWRGRPKVIAPHTVDRVAARIAEHVTRHGLERVDVVLHGGEPLLAGHERLSAIATTLRAALDGHCRLGLHVQTNGVRLDDRFCEIFAEHGIRVGISLDGDRAANDRHRRYASGRSSYDQVIRAVERLRGRRELYAGLLCTVDVANDPIAVYEALAALRPPRIDFLLPYATWDAPPERHSETAYADWLITIFERWEADGRPASVRLFESIVRTTRGEPSLTEAVGLEPSTMIVIDTDGAYELVDSLKVAYDGAPATGHDVFRHALDEVAAHPGVLARQRGLEGLSATCRECPVVGSCGGGLYTHRFRAGSFDHPSVYCADLFKLVSHIQDRTKMSSHAIPYACLDSLATGLGSADDVRLLAQAQRSVRRALIAALRPRAAGEVWELFARMDQDHRDELEQVLAHPYVRVWAVGCLRGEHPVTYLANIAAAAMIRTGQDVELPVAVIGGAVHLPTVGTLHGVGGDTVTLVARSGRITVAGHPAPEWHAVRTVSSGDYSIVLEDADPHRDCHQWPTAGRLAQHEAAAWQEAFEPAWRLIEKEYPQYAQGLRAGLTTLTPLAPASGGRDVSSTARQAFGAVAAALPADPATLALLLIHEFQHVKLGAVIDLLDLFDRSHTGLYHAPWREDLRPLEGLLQGTYAHIGVTDFWRARRHAVHGADRDTAEREFARWCGHTVAATETLAASGALTPVGERFVARMRETVVAWQRELPGLADRPNTAI
ncbi:FxsB family radical SAM/SPASM domain protein [Nonomuraea phyllanthi]|uniref:FxsB family radical SAM/SPASM domain protein n=1 Tax=Nonomuraea phyllanthi TaxID=2219224 RepID=A0A5C4WV53_9ACTN|nr:FxsB family radical SAM/SPASM domain protein [Nonomuraea phyllanthi]